MFDSKYGKVLTILLIVLIVAIVGLLCFFGYEKLKKDKNDKEAIAAIEEFNKDHNISTDATATPDVEETPTDDEDNGEIEEIVPTTPSNSENSGSTTNTSNSDGKTYYKGFVMVGYIEIPKTNVKLPILEKVTKKSLETSVAIVYPAEAELNQPGNIVIAGHNYRNQMFFSNNKKLQAGDKIYITDESGKKLTYIVYDNFEASPEDTSFYARNTDGVPEITLTTCTQDSSKRTIILAKAQ